MKKTFSLLLSFLIFLSCFSSGIAFASEYTEYEIAESNTEFAQKTAEIIKNENNPSSMLRIIGKFSKQPSDYVFSDATDIIISRDGRFVLQFSSENKLLTCLDELNKNPDIIYAERDTPIYTEALERRKNYLSWGVDAIEADIYSQKIAPTVSGRSVTVAIVDSGCEDIDFIKDKLVPGYDFFENDNDAFQDESVDSHGTLLASIVADCTRDIPVKIMPVRVLESKEGSLLNIINGIIYAVDNGADVINLSLCAILYNCNALEDAIDYAETKGVTVVVCAGNSASDTKDFCPSHCENILTVSSVNEDFVFSESFSNFGNEVDLAAPGEIVSGYNSVGEIITMNGTSLSAAFVSAAAAMFILDNPGCNTKQVRNALTSNAQDLGISGKDIYYGWGAMKLGNIPKSAETPVDSIGFPQNSYALYVGDTLEITPVMYPDSATDKSFVLSADNSNISVNGNIITAVSAGVTTLTVTSSNGMQDTATVRIAAKSPEIIATIKIRNNSGTKTINYGETLCLTAETTDQPDNTSVWWYVDRIKSGEGNTFEISPKSGSIEVTAKLVDTNGNVIIDKNNNEIFDSQTVSVKSGFFQKIISFFKNLFGLNRNVVQFFIKK